MIETQKKIVKESFKRLAILAGVEIKFGWMDELAPKIKIKRSGIYNWINRGRIPTLVVEEIEKLGYDREKWLIPDAIAWYERRYADLADGLSHQAIAGIYDRLRMAFEGLGLSVAEALFKADVPPVGDWNYFLGDVPNPKKVQQICDHLGIDKDWVWTGVGSPRGERLLDDEPEILRVAEGVSGRSDIDGKGPVILLEQSVDELVKWAREVLEGDDPALAQALRMNICQFHQSLLDRRQLKKTTSETTGPEDVAGGV